MLVSAGQDLSVSQAGKRGVGRRARFRILAVIALGFGEIAGIEPAQRLQALQDKSGQGKVEARYRNAGVEHDPQQLCAAAAELEQRAAGERVLRAAAAQNVQGAERCNDQCVADWRQWRRINDDARVVLAQV